MLFFFKGRECREEGKERETRENGGKGRPCVCVGGGGRCILNWAFCCGTFLSLCPRLDITGLLKSINKRRAEKEKKTKSMQEKEKEQLETGKAGTEYAKVKKNKESLKVTEKEKEGRGEVEKEKGKKKQRDNNFIEEK